MVNKMTITRNMDGLNRQLLLGYKDNADNQTE